MMTSISNGLRCGSKEIKMCMISQIFSIPYARSWVSKIQRNIWCWSIAVVCTDTFRMKWSSSTSPHLVRHIGLQPKLSKNSNRKSETLDLWIRSKRKVPPNRRTKDTTKAWRLKTTCQSRKQRTTLRSWRRKRESGASSIRVPLTTQVRIEWSSHWWLR